MTPFLQLRMWARRAPAGERGVVAALATVLVVLLGWAAVPVAGADAGSGADQVGLGAPQPAGLSTAAPTAAPRTSAGRAGTAGALPGPSLGGGGPVGPRVAVPGGTVVPGSTTPGAADPCGTRGATDQGVTAKQVHVDVVVADLQGQAGNTLVGLPSADEQIAMYAAAIAAANAQGGIRCRTVVAKYYKANPLDQNSLEALCLDVVADKPFALLDTGLSSPVGSPAPRDCPAAHHVPTFNSASLGQAEVDKYAPYLFSYYPAAEKTVHDAVLGAHQLGWFSGSPVVGLLEQQCNPALNTIALRDLAAIGFPSSKVKTFDFGCSNGIPAAQDVENAVLRFKAAGVTHVFDDSGVYENFFSQAAAKQGYKPKYSTGDQGTIALWSNPTFGPDPQNFDGGLVLTGTRYGEESTAGSKPNALTSWCDKAMKAKGLPSSYTSPDGFSGVACSELVMLLEATKGAPQLTRNQLAAGLQVQGTVDLPYPAGPAAFAAQRGQIGGGFWRPTTYQSSCKCFRVSRPSFARDFR